MANEIDYTKRYNIITPAGYIGTDSIVEANEYEKLYGYPIIKTHEMSGYKTPAEMNIIISNQKNKQ